MRNFTGIRGIGKNARAQDKPDLRCQVCGDAILGKARSNAAPRKYCSQSCSAQAQRDAGFAAMKERMGV